MIDGGVLTIRTVMVSDVQGRGSDSLSDFVRLEIMDTGAGMTAETLDRIVVEPERDIGNGATVFLLVVDDER